MKFRPVVIELFDTDGRTDRQTHMTKLIVAFRNFADAPKKSICFQEHKNRVQQPLSQSVVILLRNVCYSANAYDSCNQFSTFASCLLEMTAEPPMLGKEYNCEALGNEPSSLYTTFIARSLKHPHTTLLLFNLHSSLGVRD